MSASVFPARAGMSPCGTFRSGPWTRVPRASGDEPMSSEGVVTGKPCSPRERG